MLFQVICREIEISSMVGKQWHSMNTQTHQRPFRWPSLHTDVSTLEVRMWNYISAYVWDLHMRISYLILLLLYNSSSSDYTQFVYSLALVKCFNYSQSLAPANKGPVHTEPCRSLVLGVALVSLATCLRRNKAMGQSILDCRGTLTLYPRSSHGHMQGFLLLCAAPSLTRAVTSGFRLTILVSMRWCPVTTVGVQHLLSWVILSRNVIVRTFWNYIWRLSCCKVDVPTPEQN